MRLTELINESLSPILYHKTSISNAYKILNTNEFLLTPSIYHNEEDKINHKRNYYYLSTSRSKISGYYKDDTSGVILVLDGNKLSKRYSGKAVDYWGKDFRDMDPQKFESEDRLYSKNPKIPNALSYIKSIHIMNSTSKQVMEFISSIIGMAQNSNINAFLYDDNKSWLLQDTKKSIDISDKKEINTDLVKSPKISRTSGVIFLLYELLNAKSFREINYDGYDLHKRIKNKHMWGDIKSEIKHDYNYNKKSREDTHLLTRLMNRHKLKNLDDVFTFIQNKDFS